MAGDRWVLDTAYGSWTDLVLPRAELVIALDYPRWVSLGRLLRRTALRLVDRREVCNGNVEHLGNLLSSNSIVRWHFQSFRRKHARIVAWEDSKSGRACSASALRGRPRPGWLAPAASRGRGWPRRPLVEADGGCAGR